MTKVVFPGEGWMRGSDGKFRDPIDEQPWWTNYHIACFLLTAWVCTAISFWTHRDPDHLEDLGWGIGLVLGYLLYLLDCVQCATCRVVRREQMSPQKFRATLDLASETPMVAWSVRCWHSEIVDIQLDRKASTKRRRKVHSFVDSHEFPFAFLTQNDISVPEMGCGCFVVNLCGVLALGDENTCECFRQEEQRLRKRYRSIDAEFNLDLHMVIPHLKFGSVMVCAPGSASWAPISPYWYLLFSLLLLSLPYRFWLSWFCGHHDIQIENTVYSNHPNEASASTNTEVDHPVVRRRHISMTSNSRASGLQVDPGIPFDGCMTSSPTTGAPAFWGTGEELEMQTIATKVVTEPAVEVEEGSPAGDDANETPKHWLFD